MMIGSSPMDVSMTIDEDISRRQMVYSAGDPFNIWFVDLVMTQFDADEDIDDEYIDEQHAKV